MTPGKAAPSPFGGVEAQLAAQILPDAGILVTGLQQEGDTLEEYFLNRIGGGRHGTAAEG